MTLYSAFGHASEPVLAVPEKFSWFAFLLPPVFALYHGLWLMLVLSVVAIVALIGIGATVIGGSAAFWLYVLMALWCGFAAPDLRRFSLRKWDETVPVVAHGSDGAEIELLRRERAHD